MSRSAQLPSLLPRLWVLAASIGLVLVAAVVYIFWPQEGLSPEVLEQQQRLRAVALAKAQEALARNELVLAETKAREIYIADPTSAGALLVAAEAASKQGRLDAALAYYDLIPQDGSRESIISLWASGALLLQAGELSKAEEKFRAVLEHDPVNVVAHQHLAYLLSVEGRRWESLPHLLHLVHVRHFTLDHLMLLAAGEQLLKEQEHLERSLKVAPEDPAPRLGLARLALRENQPEKALEYIKPVVEQHPQLTEAQVVMGQLLLEQLLAGGDSGRLLEWHARLPDEADQHPEIWFLRGAWAQHQNDAQGAMRCYWEALGRNPNHGRASYRLTQLLIANDRPEQAERLLRRTEDLEELLQTVDTIYDEGPQRPHIRHAMRLLERLGRVREAVAWARTLQVNYPQEDLQEEITRWDPILSNDPPFVLPEANPIGHLDLSYLPLPRWQRSSQAPATAVAQAAGGAQPMFVDVAQQSGIDFLYNNGDDPNTPGMQIYQELAGGIAVLDYDQDGWPDIYLSQGSDWPPVPSQAKDFDRLYRNLGNGRFLDVTEEAGLGDNRYSQGVTVGDYNNDGFPDLYVANIGNNALYLNDGDGSFREMTRDAGLSGEAWTTSCLLADLNGDSLPDIYDVNYLGGKHVFEATCLDGEHPRACRPSSFEAEQDRLYLNLGDGRFQDVTEEAGIVADNGKGLGILAADLQGSGKLNLFVANDTTPNFYFVNQGEPGGPPKFSEQAFLAGLAVDADGRSQACMGIAFDDADADGLYDLFVTNFHNESNTYYKQATGEFFVDHTRHTGLREPSYPMLGFGTQFIDAELDGLPDLVVANGHVDDYSHKGYAFKMRPQFFRNAGHDQFVELAPETIGSYFEQEVLGRSLVRLDFDRDGQEDFAVMHLQTPFALLANRTAQAGHALRVQLRGVSGSRDAIGATVEVTTAQRTYRRQLAAGDGYQGSNQRQLVFGVGQQSVVEKITVRWPSGQQQEFLDLPVDQEILIVENHSTVHFLNTPAAGTRRDQVDTL